MRRAVLVATLCAGCGYHALYAGAGAERYHVHLGRVGVPSAAVADEVARGARDELARDGALAPGDGFPRLEIEVLRLDETSEGVARTTGDVPLARGTELGVLARAYVVRSDGAARELDTGDLKAEDIVEAPEDDPRREVFLREDTLRAVARRLGQRLAARVLGHPAANESLGREPP